jgi:hypothetical protein
MGVGGIIFNFLGAAVRWLYGTIWRTIANKKKYTFNEYLSGPKNSKDWYDMTGHTFVNRIIGLITLVFILWMIMKLG